MYLGITMNHQKSDLKIDWCTHEAAKYAVENWHYSKVLPVGKIVKVGAWEDKKFIGCVLFSRGANKNMGKKYGCTQIQCIELTRISLRKHKTPVSKIMAIAIRFLKSTNTGLKLIVSYADMNQGHHGGIYQATNWIYDGETKLDSISVNGKIIHRKSLYSKYGHSSVEKLLSMGLNVKRISSLPKHRYLMPLDNEMRDTIKHLAKPYPKRTTKATSSDQLESGGAIPTCTLQPSAVNQ